jgi:hypothetical protein
MRRDQRGGGSVEHRQVQIMHQNEDQEENVDVEGGENYYYEDTDTLPAVDYASGFDREQQQQREQSGAEEEGGGSNEFSPLILQRRVLSLSFFFVEIMVKRKNFFLMVLIIVIITYHKPVEKHRNIKNLLL